MKPIHLSKPPIREAVIEIRYEHAAEISFDIINSLLVKNKWETIEPVENKNIHITSEGKSVEKTVTVGFRAINKDRTRIIRYDLDRVSVSILDDYDKWDSFVDYLSEQRSIYEREFNPIKITQISTRFINNIEIPLRGERTNVDDYLLCLPPSPGGKKEIYKTLSSTIILDQPEYDVLIKYHQAIGDSIVSTIIPKSYSSPYTLDIDVVHKKSYDVNDEKLSNVLETLHDRKNFIFWGSITELLIEPYK